jgi:hypothetical protein
MAPAFGPDARQLRGRKGGPGQIAQAGRWQVERPRRCTLRDQRQAQVGAGGAGRYGLALHRGRGGPCRIGHGDRQRRGGRRLLRDPGRRLFLGFGQESRRLRDGGDRLRFGGRKGACAGSCRASVPWEGWGWPSPLAPQWIELTGTKGWQPGQRRGCGASDALACTELGRIGRIVTIAGQERQGGRLALLAPFARWRARRVCRRAARGSACAVASLMATVVAGHGFTPRMKAVWADQLIGMRARVGRGHRDGTWLPDRAA